MLMRFDPFRELDRFAPAWTIPVAEKAKPRKVEVSVSESEAVPASVGQG